MKKERSGLWLRRNINDRLTGWYEKLVQRFEKQWSTILFYTAWVKVFSILTDFSFFGKGPDSSWNSCKFDEFFKGGGTHFGQRIKKNWEDPDLFKLCFVILKRFFFINETVFNQKKIWYASDEEKLATTLWLRLTIRN